ncbi:MAG: heparinase II/III family protein [Bacteroidales bacterium]|nr:heparinase II/III family protein [Bacteroidales bacterium]
MKRLYICLLLVVFVFGIKAQTDYVTINTKLPNHPRILMLKGEERSLMKKINKDPYWKELQANVLESCDKIIEQPASERVMEGIRLLTVSRRVLARVFNLSYAYRTTGQKKYAARAEKEMLAAADFSDWNPSHFLDVGEMTMALAIGYDWCYNYLSADSRAKIKTAIIEKGIKQSFGKWYLESGNNWNQVCNAGITYGCLATFEDCKELAVERINTAFESIKLPMKAFAPDGAYPEGAGYWSYGTSFNVLFLAAVEKALGSDFGLSKLPGFLTTGMYSQSQITPAGHIFTYSDNWPTAEFLPEVFYFYSKTKDPALLYLQKKCYEKGNHKSMIGNRVLPIGLILGAGSGASLANPEKPKSLMWTGRGSTPVAVMRSGWDENDTYLGFKMGSPSAPHGHMDVGSFIFEADGIRWSYDMGADDYNRLESRGVDLWNSKQESQRWDVFRYRTQSHSTLMFNDKPQLVKGFAELGKYSDEENAMSVESDLSAIYKDQIPGVKRAVSLVDKKYAVIHDQLTTAGQFTKMTWNMFTHAEKVTFVDDTTALLEKDGKKLYLKVDAPFPVRFYTRDATPTNTYDSPNKVGRFVGFEADLALNTTQEVKVYLMPGKLIDNPKTPHTF